MLRTGFTDPVITGKITTLTEFTKNCFNAFFYDGYERFVKNHQDSIDYYQKEIDEGLADLKLTDEEILAKEEADYQSSLEFARKTYLEEIEGIERMKKLMKLLEDNEILYEAYGLENQLKFMKEQLNITSLDYKPYDPPRASSPEDWRESVRDNLKWSRKQLEKSMTALNDCHMLQRKMNALLVVLNGS